MQYWKVKAPIIKGTNYAFVIKEALKIYRYLEKKTKRRAHIRSKIFKKEKVFLNIFWDHLHQKNPKDRRRRLRYYPCALELIEQTTYKPEIKITSRKSRETWYRLYGETTYGEKFIVQVKSDNKAQLHLMSIFPHQ